MRAAIYFTPPADHPLTQAAGEWLGRDAFADRVARAPDETRDPLVAEPARYGFHATMRAPFRLREGLAPSDVEEALLRFAAGRPAFSIAEIVLGQLGHFFALVPAEAPPELARLERDVLAAFEPFRASLTAEEIARRKVDRLSERQRALLDRWGYPFVEEEFRFHMTLTGPIPAERRLSMEENLRGHFSGFLGQPLPVDGLALFLEDEAGAPLRVARRAAFIG